MKKLPVTSLTNKQLDYAVAVCEKQTPIYTQTDQAFKSRKSGIHLNDYPYSTDWAQGGPILAREISGYTRRGSLIEDWFEVWISPARSGKEAGIYGCGTTLLIAAMRCYVCSVMGDEVEIPEELLD